MKRATAIQKTYHTERKLFYASGALVLALFGAYIYFVSAAVAHVVVRKELTQEIAKTQTHISELESEYIAAQNAVGIEAALARGFLKNEEKVFVEKADAALALSRNDSR